MEDSSFSPSLATIDGCFMRGEAFAGRGFRRTGEDAGTAIRCVCARKAENEGTAILTGKACLWRIEESKGAPSCLKGSMVFESKD